MGHCRKNVHPGEGTRATSSWRLGLSKDSGGGWILKIGAIVATKIALDAAPNDLIL